MTSDKQDRNLLLLVTHHSSLVTAFVGRAKELQRLAAAFAKAGAGQRQVVFITGPAGIGKTALVEAFLAQLPAPSSANNRTTNNLTTCVVARGQCVEQHGPREAYLPVLDALDRLARRSDADRMLPLLRRVAPTWLAQMPWLIGDDEEEALRQTLQVVRPERMLREFAALIEALTIDVTLVLVLEDLHWSDASTIDLLSMLAERREAARVLVIGTYRPADAIVREHVLMSIARTLRVRRQCVELSLPDLTLDAVRNYFQTRFPGSDFPPQLARRVHQHTAGHPLFVTAVVDQMLSRSHILDTAPGWALHALPEQIDLGVPDDVRLLIENQIDDLSPADRALLEAASVAGDTFAALVVAAALGGEVADAEMRCEAFARAQRFLRVAGRVEWPDGSVARRYAFTHELYRQVVYAAIPEGRCMRLHQRIGQALEAAYGARQMEIAPQLALHFERGRDGTRALHHLTAAAAGAAKRFASREAIGYLEAALALVALFPEDDKRHRRELEIRLPLGAALSDIFGFASERVRDNYERASILGAVVGTATELFGILYARWYLHAIRGERKETAAIAAELQHLAGRLKTAASRMVVESVMVRTAVYAGRFAEANHLMQRTLARPGRRRPVGAPIAYGVDPRIAATGHWALALWFLGYPERARTTASAAVAQARTMSHSFTLAGALMQAALVDLLCRDGTQRGDLAAQGVTLSAEHGFAFWNAMTSALGGWAVVQEGRPLEGVATIEAALSAMQATGTRLFSNYVYAFLAEGHLRAGALAEGLAAADAGLAVTETTLDCGGGSELWRLKGELLLAQLNAQGPRAQPGSAKAGHAKANAARPAEACFQRAVAVARAAHAKSLELRAATSLARAWQSRGRIAEARKLLGSVCKWFGARAHSTDLAEARGLLAELQSSKIR